MSALLPSDEKPLQENIPELLPDHVPWTPPLQAQALGGRGEGVGGQPPQQQPGMESAECVGAEWLDVRARWPLTTAKHPNCLLNGGEALSAKSARKVTGGREVGV